jgi:hypothetical protein
MCRREHGGRRDERAAAEVAAVSEAQDEARHKRRGVARERDLRRNGHLSAARACTRARHAPACRPRCVAAGRAAEDCARAARLCARAVRVSANNARTGFHAERRRRSKRTRARLQAVCGVSVARQRGHEKQQQQQRQRQHNLITLAACQRHSARRVQRRRRGMETRRTAGAAASGQHAAVTLERRGSPRSRDAVRRNARTQPLHFVATRVASHSAAQPLPGAVLRQARLLVKPARGCCAALRSGDAGGGVREFSHTTTRAFVPFRCERMTWQ